MTGMGAGHNYHGAAWPGGSQREDRTQRPGRGGGWPAGCCSVCTLRRKPVSRRGARKATGHGPSEKPNLSSDLVSRAEPVSGLDPRDWETGGSPEDGLQHRSEGTTPQVCPTEARYSASTCWRVGNTQTPGRPVGTRSEMTQGTGGLRHDPESPSTRSPVGLDVQEDPPRSGSERLLWVPSPNHGHRASPQRYDSKALWELKKPLRLEGE